MLDKKKSYTAVCQEKNSSTNQIIYTLPPPPPPAPSHCLFMLTPVFKLKE